MPTGMFMFDHIVLKKREKYWKNKRNYLNLGIWMSLGITVGVTFVETLKQLFWTV